MAGYYDVYCLAPTRTAEAIQQFLEHFAPVREESAEEYEVLQFANSSASVFPTADQLIAHCVSHPSEPYGVYWRCLNQNDPAHAMVFFTADQALLLGLSVSENAQAWLDELNRATCSTAGWIAFETPPPDTAREFLDLVQKRPL